MNDDLKAYIDGELPPDAADRLRERMVADPALALEGEEFRRLSIALQNLTEPTPVGQAATLAALARRQPLWRGWSVALAGCAAVLLIVSTLPSRMYAQAQVRSAGYERVQPSSAFAPPQPSSEVSEKDSDLLIPAERQEEFTRTVEAKGGTIVREADSLRATYPKSAHEDVVRELDLPRRTAWAPGGLRLRLRP